MPLQPFAAGEVATFLGDPDVALLSEAALRSVRDGGLLPLAEGLAAIGRGGSPGPNLRKAAFAASVQGLSPRLARIPDATALPDLLVERFRLEADRCEARGRRIVQRLREVLALLSAEGIEAIPLKGAALLLRGEANPGLRPMGDLDLLLVEPADVRRAAAVLERNTPYRPLLDTPRHLVLAEENESVPSPAGEHPSNPLRIELHRSFRLPVLGVVLDPTKGLRADAAPDAQGIRLPSDAAMLRHLWHHAAEDFAAKGLRGIQALDFLDRARRAGPLSADLPEEDLPAAAPLLYAAEALERLFPGTFEPASLARLAAGVPAVLRERAAALPVLRHARAAGGFSRTALSLAPHRLAEARFLVRTAFPTLGEVRANVAPDCDGAALGLAWVRVFLGRARALMR
ncbi:MAG: nucleotidyltransferase family protein [Holophagales bacterium]|nr:nucleotidyltransferase family protein [Holophagales bacterium]MBK9965720.1 nucleotidyltransferase family protein [Holophagales bacterium]